MSQPNIVSVNVLKTSRYNTEMPPDNLIDAIKWLKGKLDWIPEEYRASASFELGAKVDYDGCADGYVVISYERPETEVEIAERIALETRRAEERKKVDLDKLRELKAKYPDAI